LLLKSLILPWKPDVFVCHSLFYPTTSDEDFEVEVRKLMNAVQDRGVEEMGPTSARGTRT
jgi:hypothetical protein